MKVFAVAAMLCCLAVYSFAGSVAPRDGWAVHDTPHSYTDLMERLKKAIKSNKMGLVTQAGPTEVAKRRGFDIPGNRVFGVFRNDYAVRAIRLSVPAMIEAPIRMYVTEDEDGSATLSYKTPSHVFAPYLDEGGADLKALAEELDGVFAAIAADAIK